MSKIETSVQKKVDEAQEKANETGASVMCVIEINGMEFYRAIKAQKKVVKKSKSKKS